MSPILYVIDDLPLPDMLHDVEASLFAVDSAV